MEFTSNAINYILYCSLHQKALSAVLKRVFHYYNIRWDGSADNDLIVNVFNNAASVNKDTTFETTHITPTLIAPPVNFF